MAEHGPIALIVNAKARRGKLWFDSACAKFDELGIDFFSRSLIEEADRIEPEIRKAISAGCQTVIVGGGDGTLSAAARLLAREKRVLGVLPLGTGNAFARDLGIRTDIDHAVAVIAAGNVEEVDYGIANGQIFLNLASMGLTTIVARYLRRAPKGKLGPLAYAVPVLQAIRLIRPFQAKLTMDDEQVELSAYLVVVGNGRFHAGPFPIGPDAAIDSGEFFIYAVQAEGKGVLFRYMLNVLMGRQTEMPEIQVWRRPQVNIETLRPRRIVLDGEISETTPCQFQVVPRGLKVFMPAKEE